MKAWIDNYNTWIPETNPDKLKNLFEEIKLMKIISLLFELKIVNAF